ncbi:MAG: hypothetical protein V3U17_06995 [Thermoplasmata archaeon]
MEDRDEVLDTDDLREAHHKLEGPTDSPAAILAAWQPLIDGLIDRLEVVLLLREIMANPRKLETMAAWFEKSKDESEYGPLPED